jgi:hypothetical protein
MRYDASKGGTAIRVRLLGLLGLLSTIGVLLQPVPASSASWLPPRTVYVDAVQRLIWTHGFDMTVAVSYPAGTAHSGIFYRAPQHLRLLNPSGPKQGQYVRVQVRRTACDWWTGRKFHRIFCRGNLWDDGFIAQQVTSALLGGLLPQATFVRATTASDRQRGIVRIAISAPESPPLCAPWLACPNAAYNPHGRYRAVLLVAVSGGLPLSFSSAIALQGHTRTFQRVTFSYHRLAPITLPAGRHIRCPSSATSGQWCLARR